MSELGVVDGEIAGQASLMSERYVPLAPSKIDPEAIVTDATRKANVLMKVVKAAGLEKQIGPNKYLLVEAWQTTARFDSCLIDTGWVRRVVRDTVVGYEAQARLRRLSDGAVLAMAEACCMMNEQLERDDGTLFDRWTEEYAAESMAQTRAQGKVGRMIYGFVAVLAGYQSTPAEEMDGVRGKGKTAIVFPFGDHKGQSPADLDLPELRYTLGFWQKKAAEPGKYQANNARIVKAIEDAIAEKSAPVRLKDKNGNAIVGEVSNSLEQDDGALKTGQPDEAPAGDARDPGPREAAFVRLNEMMEAKAWTKANVAMLAHKLYPESKGVLTKLDATQIEAICAKLNEEPNA